MKLYKFIISLLIVGFTFTACNDWLDDIRQTSTVSDEVVWQDEEAVNSYINSFYPYLHDYGQFGDVQCAGALTEGLTDVLMYGSYAFINRGKTMSDYAQDPNTISAESCIYSVWAGVSGSVYEHIRLVNQFLVMQKNYSTFPKEKNDVWEAQARFFRAFLYFQLAKRHGGVILYDALPKPGGKARSTSEETWQFIADDLDFAARYLPKEWSNNHRGRVTKGAAFALKSRAMLYAKRWQDAYNAADSVINLKIYGLMDNYEDSWKGGNKESILEFAYDKQTGPNHRFDRFYAPGYDKNVPGTPTQEMVECYETKSGEKVDWTLWHTSSNATPPYEQLEPRFKATIIYRGSVWQGKTMDCSIDGTNGVYIPYRQQVEPFGKTVTGYFLRKLLDEKMTDIESTKSAQTWVEIRYAEVLLNKAEAAYRLNRIGEAQSALNGVRARTGVNLPGKTSTGETWFKDYRNERKVELAYEGHLFWDMRRWKLAHIEYNNYRVHGMKITGASNTYEYVDCESQDRRFIPKQYVLPVPAAELRDNPLIEQYDEWK